MSSCMQSERTSSTFLETSGWDFLQNYTWLLYSSAKNLQGWKGTPFPTLNLYRRWPLTTYGCYAYVCQSVCRVANEWRLISICHVDQRAPHFKATSHGLHWYGSHHVLWSCDCLMYSLLYYLGSQHSGLCGFSGNLSLFLWLDKSLYSAIRRTKQYVHACVCVNQWYSRNVLGFWRWTFRRGYISKRFGWNIAKRLNKYRLNKNVFPEKVTYCTHCEITTL